MYTIIFIAMYILYVNLIIRLHGLKYEQFHSLIIFLILYLFVFFQAITKGKIP